MVEEHKCSLEPNPPTPVMADRRPGSTALIGGLGGEARGPVSSGCLTRGTGSMDACPPHSPSRALRPPKATLSVFFTSPILSTFLQRPSETQCWIHVCGVNKHPTALLTES